MNSAIKKAAAEELLARRQARRSLAQWARLCGYEPARHHLLLIDRLEAVVRGDIRKLAVFLPPGSAKSTYSSILFPPWFLSQRPNSAILVCSHSAELAEGFGRRSRNLIQDKELVLGYSLTEDSQAAGRWATTNGGMFFCAGVGGRIAGWRADLALIDDPVGSKEDAYSDLQRERNWSWFNYDLRPRLKPNARVILIQTRWHTDDLAGRILAAEGDEWTVIKVPLVAEEGDSLGRQPGELLWPEWFNERTLSEAKKDDDVFNCLYQQNPTPETGNYFKREWIDDNAYGPDDLPKNLRYYVGSDHAVSLKQEADLTCLLPVGVDESDTLWILPDIFWSKADSAEAVEAMLALMRRRRPVAWWAEAGHISKSIGPFLTKRMREENVYTYVEEVVSSRDKPTRAQSIRGRMKCGQVRFPRFAPWFEAARRELLAFPVGEHDDFVDALSEIGQGLDRMLKPEIPQRPVSMPEPLTVKWLKNSSAWMQRRGRVAALMDN